MMYSHKIEKVKIFNLLEGQWHPFHPNLRLCLEQFKNIYCPRANSRFTMYLCNILLLKYFIEILVTCV